ncbi:mycofactocin biosynthesis chaperone MftB [Saccharopolyspora shandongensis]|uniref:mycofactocin biosynthesis chaperone MftB n=1 Tax=Saccharopolyspora shandongensis TaxID=418495 RepID=UPI003F4DCC55
MSTERRVSGGRSLPPEARDHPAFEPDGPYALSPNVALRPEPFGALAYHFGNRRLSFLKTPLLVTVVQGLHKHRSARAALSAHGVARHEERGYLSALASLARADMIVRA